LAIPALGQQDVLQSDQQALRDFEMQLTTAFNRQDATGVASLFTEDALRVTPQGIRAFGNSIWETGEWSMMIGDRPVRGYFSETVVREGDKYKIRDETFNVVPPTSGQQPASK
jgi:ketosteroid isomerase-like protein